MLESHFHTVSSVSVTGETGDAKTSFMVNISPVYGKCTVSPEQGVALETDFRVHCTDWREYQVHRTLDKPCHEKTSNVVSEQVDTNRAVQTQKQARSLKFSI